MITYKTLQGNAEAVYLDGRRAGTIVELSVGRWQYLPEGRGNHKGEILPSLRAVKNSLEAE